MPLVSYLDFFYLCTDPKWLSEMTAFRRHLRKMDCLISVSTAKAVETEYSHVKIAF